MSQGEAEALRRDAELSENRIAGSIAGSRWVKTAEMSIPFDNMSVPFDEYSFKVPFDNMSVPF